MPLQAVEKDLHLETPGISMNATVSFMGTEPVPMLLKPEQG